MKPQEIKKLMVTMEDQVRGQGVWDKRVVCMPLKDCYKVISNLTSFYLGYWDHYYRHLPQEEKDNRWDEWGIMRESFRNLSILVNQKRGKNKIKCLELKLND